MKLSPDTLVTPSIGDLPEPGRFAAFHPFLRGVFSQWHRTPFCIEGVTFNTAEQWMMANTAVLFGDHERAVAVMDAEDPAEQKRLGQLVSDFDSATWDNHKVAIVYHGNRAKFAANAGARRQLLATGDAMLVEANPRDWIWGCGLPADDPQLSNPMLWRGENLLGRILTLIRTELATALDERSA